VHLCYQGFSSVWVAQHARNSAAGASTATTFGATTKEARRLADNFLVQICEQMAITYFPQFANVCAEFLTALLRSGQRKYHAVVLQMTQVPHLNHLRFIHIRLPHACRCS